MRLFIEFRKHLQRYGLEYFNRYYGVYRGTVVDNNDPDKLGRLKVSVPQIYGDQAHNYWAWPKGMFAGKNKGAMMLPAIDDAVYVCFEGGDARYPIWEHGWWGNGDTIEEAEDSYPQMNIIKTQAGHRVEIDDKEGVLRVVHRDGHHLEINDQSISIVREGKTIALGALNEADQPAVLGNTTESKLEEVWGYLDDISGALGKMKTAFKPLNPVDVTAIASVATKLDISLPLTKETIKNIKSKNVSVDE